MSDNRAGSGQWVHQDVNVHKCQKPAYSSTVCIGDVWQCDCKRKYQVKRIECGMQHDPCDPFIIWGATSERGAYER